MNKPTAPIRNNDQAAVAAAPEISAPPPAPQSDEHAGKGGMYELVNGQRVLLDRTKEQTTNLTAKTAA